MMHPSASAVRALVCGLPPGKWQSRLLCMLKVYVDDSGAGAPLLVVAGYIAPASRWIAFTEQWEAALAPLHLRGPFKMKDAIGLSANGYWRAGATSEARQKLRDAKLMELAEIIRANVGRLVWSGVSWDVYRLAMKLNVPREFRNPFFFVFVNLVGGLCEALDREGSKDKIEFYLDEKPGADTEAIHWWRFLQDKHPSWAWRIPKPLTPEKDDDLVPLQAADMLANSIWRSYAEGARPELAVLRGMDEIDAKIDEQAALRILSEMNP